MKNFSFVGLRDKGLRILGTKPSDEYKDMVKFNTSKEYAEMVNKVAEAEKKYSTTYNPPEVDFPESLNQQKLTYVMPTEDELYKSAEKLLGDKYLTKYNDITADARKKFSSISKSIDQEKLKMMLRNNQYDNELEKAKISTEKENIKRGLARSSIADGSQKKIEDDYEDKKNVEQTNTNANVMAMEKELKNLNEITNDMVQSLNDGKKYELEALTTKMLDEAKKTQQDVIKYNNDIDKAESKYVASIKSKQKALQNDEYMRTMKVMQLAKELGEDTFAELVRREKAQAVEDYLFALPKKDALLALQTDILIQDILGEYLPVIEDKIKNK